MNFLSLLTKEKHVAGIEISDSIVRIAYFRSKGKRATTPRTKKILDEAEVAIGIKKENVDEELVLIEEPIGANIIADGEVIDVDLLSKTLKTIWAKANLETNYAIVAIPDDKIYSRIFSFPKSVSETRLTEAMRLAVGFQLPQKTEDIYLDWERTAGTQSTNEIYLSTIPRAVAQGYINALEKAGIKTLALESSLTSIARAAKVTPGETVIFSKNTPDGTTIFALKDGLIRFSRTLPTRFVPENKVPEEISKIKTALLSETKGVVTDMNVTDALIRDEYANDPALTEPKSKWLIVLGAALRGKIPEGEDNLVSLLPIGTEEAYAYQRATTFIIFIRNLIIGVSIFFLVAFAATYLFMLSLSGDTAEQVATLSNTNTPAGLTDSETKISTLNSYTETGSVLLAETPIWSTVVSSVLTSVPDGITVAAFSAPSFTEKFSLTGVAKDRDILNNYKKILQDNPLFSEVELPLTNLEAKGEIPFTMSFRLKDPRSLYYPNVTP